MGIRAIAVACVLAATVATATAEPHAALAWHAPDDCPDARDVRARVERRLGEPIDRFAVAFDVDVVRAEQIERGFIAHVGARTLTSETCEDLADAVALIVARLASEAPRREVPRPAVPPGPVKWSGGVRGSWMSGIGVVPSVAIGGELAGFVRRDRLFAELALADWEQGTAIASGLAPQGTDVGLRTSTVRLGYAPAPGAIRGWLALDLGRMTHGSDPYVTTGPGSDAWVAVGPGFAVAWPIAPRVRLVGTMEVLANVTRAVFREQDGMAVYEPSAVSARTTVGLELGWP